MSLSQYKHKRNSKTTPEPFGGATGKDALHFVIQKHAASHLHYDFRLEMNGVLKSWAVPKGPSLNPADKRLAMMVEDHPYDYKDFEGIIPKGNYGAGTVIVWDEGTYIPIDESKGKKAQERSLMKQLKAGSLKVRLSGSKLKGEFALVKTGMAENSWLLIKHKDQHAATTDVTRKARSVLSNKTLEEIKPGTPKAKATKAAEPEAANKNPAQARKAAKKTKRDAIPTQKKEEPPDSITATLKGLPHKPFPRQLSPMLATLVDAPFDDEDWAYEIKWDGYRALAFRKGKTATIRSRNDKVFDEKFYPVLDALEAWDVEAVIDGEIVAVDEKGMARFNQLQNWRSEADGQLQYYVFDVLWYTGKQTTGLPLSQRMALLKAIVPPGDGIIRLGLSVTGRGQDLFKAARDMGLEGIMAKRLDSPYLPGIRTQDWLKIKVQKRQEVVIAGYTRNTGSPKLFSALLLGVYEQGKLQYAGKVGTGFDQQQQEALMKRFRPLVLKKSPFKEIPDYNKPSRFRPKPPDATATWLKPQLVCEITFTEITEDGVFRHPSFLALREDKKATGVTREKEAPVAVAVKQPAGNRTATKKSSPGKAKTAARKEKQSIIRPPVKQPYMTLLNPTDKTQVRKIGRKELTFTNLDKRFWPREKITKRDLVNYYHQVADYILPYIKDRPQSLNRYPDGYKGKSFYQKDVTGKVPGWATTYGYRSEGDKTDKHFLVAKDEASLLYMVNAGCIEINPWNSTIKKPDHPDWCLLDLDPGTRTTFNQVIDVAQVIHDLLQSLGVDSYPKTSGSTGLHIYIPLGRKYTYEQSKEFARVIVTLVQQQTSAYTSLERQVRARKGKLYLDFLQNRPQATLAAPYSVRPKPGATVSMPLHWNEVKHGLKMSDFTLSNVPALLNERGDLFKGVLGKGILMSSILKKIKQATAS
ncbi:DNA ligase D [Taibaiella chishuiensis]|uniref:DNA ligase (ATP) n=1 Tax=Taibaiella chishuiensis TaxID=1434707 RepID=A0A2P8D376_9BACT|nr:DNA ligase D [Taibaiella chishuiensis]PSK91672.1 bifunctional non-homologous end joining protein LigD [Taibaiella chishuiensis]